jgi:hypothetical protein
MPVPNHRSVRLRRLPSPCLLVCPSCVGTPPSRLWRWQMPWQQSQRRGRRRPAERIDQMAFPGTSPPHPECNPMSCPGLMFVHGRGPAPQGKLGMPRIEGQARWSPHQCPDEPSPIGIAIDPRSSTKPQTSRHGEGPKPAAIFAAPRNIVRCVWGRFPPAAGFPHSGPPPRLKCFIRGIRSSFPSADPAGWHHQPIATAAREDAIRGPPSPSLDGHDPLMGFVLVHKPFRYPFPLWEGRGGAWGGCRLVEDSTAERRERRRGMSLSV